MCAVFYIVFWEGFPRDRIFDEKRDGTMRASHAEVAGTQD